MLPEEDLIKQRLKKLEEIRKKGINPYPYKFGHKDHAKDILEKYSKLNKEEKTSDNVAVAGRIVLLRRMGKASFAHIQDQSGRIQFYIREDRVGKEQYELFNLLDLGDIVGVKGTIFRTKMGEISVLCDKLELLAKSIRPLPEKWHGLKDVEARYRKRYLDLISNPEVKEIFFKRSKIINAMREFLDNNKFLEVDTPILQTVYGGANAKPFKTFLHDLKMDVYMRISDELYLKRLIIGGFERVYEIGRDFRNESIDRTHNPEFTMMECYATYWDYNDMMEFTEDMTIYMAKKILGKTEFEYQGVKINLKKPWKKITLIDALKEYAKIDVNKLSDEEIQDLIREKNIKYEGEYNKGLAIDAVFKELVESKLIQPIFILDHPKETTPLCKLKRGNDVLVERFEPFIFGMEIGNAYSELNDPVIQKQLFEMQKKLLNKDEAHPVDTDFIEAMEYGMPPMGGLGIGLDRIVMLFLNQPSIRDVILFPFMKK
ncbi:MAG: lysine--tRNA ligase [Nanoarchaeota archaeon]